jgi:hypothetical protein
MKNSSISDWNKNLIIIFADWNPLVTHFGIVEEREIAA